MPSAASPPNRATEARVIIRRPVAAVFAFYRDFANLPRFLGDVMAVTPTGPATYRWTVGSSRHSRKLADTRDRAAQE
jgi:uncharacterized membrane protein